MQSRSWQERLLVVLLRVGAVLTLSAFLAMVMPTAWMVEIHAWLGLGQLATTPITEYLARSLSAMYGFHGGLVLVVSFDVRRFRPIVGYLGAMTILLGACLLGIDLNAGLPPWWTWFEGPPLAAFGAVLLWLRQAIPAE